MQPPCPACESTAWEPWLTARDMHAGAEHAIVRCAACATGRTSFEADRALIVAIHEGSAGPDAGARCVGGAERVLRGLRRRRADLVARVAGRGGRRVLDVGCGRGAMLVELASRGWDAYGLELSRGIAATAQAALGARVVPADLLEHEWPDALRFDVVTFWHSLEHVTRPFESLVRARELLAPGGTVLVEVPDAASWQARWTGRHWLHLDVPRHRWHFSSSSLVRMARRAGLEPVSLRHFSLEHGPYGLFQSLLARMGLGHDLFTRVLRRRAEGPDWRAALRHAALAPLLLPLAALSLPLEAAAAACGRGGVVRAVFAAREEAHGTQAALTAGSAGTSSSSVRRGPGAA